MSEQEQEQERIVLTTAEKLAGGRELKITLLDETIQIVKVREVSIKNAAEVMVAFTQNNEAECIKFYLGLKDDSLLDRISIEEAGKIIELGEGINSFALGKQSERLEKRLDRIDALATPVNKKLKRIEQRNQRKLKVGS